MEIFLLHSNANGNVSLTDCSVWHYALKNNYTLLTGDAQLRKKAIESNVTVKGIIYIFDLLVENQIITPQQAANKLSELKMINKRLPRKIIDERIGKWKV
jgi:predicted nucleic acid-binding protein